MPPRHCQWNERCDDVGAHVLMADTNYSRRLCSKHALIMLKSNVIERACEWIAIHVGGNMSRQLRVALNAPECVPTGGEPLRPRHDDMTTPEGVKDR